MKPTMRSRQTSAKSITYFNGPVGRGFDLGSEIPSSSQGKGLSDRYVFRKPMISIAEPELNPEPTFLNWSRSQTWGKTVK